MNRNLLFLLICVISVLLAGISANAVPKPEADPYAPKIKEGEVAPDFIMKNADGTVINLSMLKGKVVLVNIFAYWCPPCNAEAPDLQALYDENKAEGFVMVGVAGGRNKEEPEKEFLANNQKFIAKHKWTVPFVDDIDSAVSKAYGIKAYPTSFLIGKDGKVALIKVGGGAGVKEEWQEVLNPYFGKELKSTKPKTKIEPFI